MTQLVFEYDTEYGVFRDALDLPDDHTYTDIELDAMKQQRLTDWVERIKATVGSGELQVFEEPQ